MAFDPVSLPLSRPFDPHCFYRNPIMKTAHILSAIALSTTLAAPLPALADAGSSCHFHGSKPATEAVVGNCAVQQRDSFVKNGKIDASWKDIQPASPEQVEGKKAKEWKVVFQNPAASDASKKTLYMFFSLPGNFIAANYTGQ
jgi:hypothetical protein